MTRVVPFPDSAEALAVDRSPTDELSEQEEISSTKLQDEEESSVDDDEDSALWRTNLFTLYARVFRIMLAKWKETMRQTHEEDKSRELDELILPSNEQWRFQVYYRLVDLQREIDLGVTANTIEMRELEPEVEAKRRKSWDWEPAKREYPIRPKSGNVDASIASLALAINDTNGSMTEACIEPGWRVGDIILAAQVLQGFSSTPRYKDEAEMRRVFGLVYDVLRYKQILNQALRDVGFWYRYSEHKNREKIVWLLLYDMQGRKFSRRGDTSVVESRERAFHEASIKDIEDALIDTKTHLAASVSRLRIGGSALALDELLPAHLRTAEGVIWGDDGASMASGWVNTIKISSKAEFVGEMAKLELRLCVNCNEIELDENHYVFDPVCPKVVNLHDKAREKLAMSDLVMSHRFIFLERSLCLGAAALAQAIRCGRLCGPVVLTHSIAPRHTAYLAGLIADIEDAGRLLAFGTGDQRSQYEEYLGKLGVTTQQCHVFSERYVNPPPIAELERATIVLASPPSSYTGVRDVVDLAVARGGDTALLETLTNVDIELDKPKALLTEQLTTLKYALSRPNVQMLIYEAHSILPSETIEMVKQVVQHVNQMATDKYCREHLPKRIKPSSREPATKLSRTGKSSKRGQPQDHKMDSFDERKVEEEEETSRVSTELEVPESDLFVIGSATDIYGRESAKFLNGGCYLAVIKRKEMMQFNSLFMIKVAESKGLFGDPTKQQQQQIPKEEQNVLAPIRQGSELSSRKRSKRPKIQIDRIAASTHSSMVRSIRGRKEPSNGSCPRHKQRVVQDQRLSSDQISHPSSNKLPRALHIYSGSVVGGLKVQREKNRPSTDKSMHEILNETVLTKDLNVIHLNSEKQLKSLYTENAMWGKQSGWPKQSSSDQEIAKLENKEYRNTSTFCFEHGVRALAHATQKISLDNITEERDKENFSKFQETTQTVSASTLKNNNSRVYHPGGFLKFSRLKTSSISLTKNAKYF